MIKSWNFSVHFCLCAVRPFIWVSSGLLQRKCGFDLWFGVMPWCMMHSVYEYDRACAHRLRIAAHVFLQMEFCFQPQQLLLVWFSSFLRLCLAPSLLVCLSSSFLSNMEFKFHIRIWKLEKRICLSLYAYLERNQLQIFMRQVYLKLWVMETQASYLGSYFSSPFDMQVDLRTVYILGLSLFWQILWWQMICWLSEMVFLLGAPLNLETRKALLLHRHWVTQSMQ